MNEYDEQTLQSDKVVELLNEITTSKQDELDRNNFGKANMLGRCHDMIRNMHIVNTEAIRENRAMSDHYRTHMAGMAMQGLLAGVNPEQGYQCNIVEQAFGLADKMVEYGKKNSEAKCTDDDTGSTSTKDSD